MIVSRTSVWTAENQNWLVHCPNQFMVKDTFPNKDIFRTTREDNDVGLSNKDGRFLDVKNANVRKNEKGNWEMPLSPSTKKT